MPEPLHVQLELNQDLAIRVKHIVRPVLKIACGLDASGLENLPGEAPYIVASTHSSDVDPFAVGVYIPDSVPMYFPAKHELGKIPAIGKLLPKIGAIYFDRDNKDEAGRVFQEAGNILDAGGVPILFPEATRWQGPLVRPDMRDGTTVLSRRKQVPIVPCGVGGNDKVLRRPFSPLSRHISLVFGEPLEPTEDGSRKSRQAYADELHKRLQELKDRANEQAGADFAKARRPITNQPKRKRVLK